MSRTADTGHSASIDAASEPVDEHFRRCLLADSADPAAAPPLSMPPLGIDEAEMLTRLFDAQAQSRHLDFAARWLQRRGEGFYTIGSAGHEANAALGVLSRKDDPALLHYRSGAFYAARAHKGGTPDPVLDALRSLTCSVEDPISGGRHKVIGHLGLHIVPQTSTISSHLPRAVGLAFSMDLARSLERTTPWAGDAVVLCSFGDASANHSTAAGAFNTAAYLSHRGRACPVLFVCEDNGIGISTRSPRGWPEAALRSLPGIPYFQVAGHEPRELLRVTAETLATVRATRAPAVLHVATVRYMGHAGSDVELAYRSSASIAADYQRDPLLATARTLVAGGVWTAKQTLEHYERVRSRVRELAAQVILEPRLVTREEVVAPLAFPSRIPPRPAPILRGHSDGAGRSMTLAQAINATLTAEMDADPGLLVFGEDVATKGGVYGVTKGLEERFGRLRVFDTLLDEQTVLGTALGASLAGFTPVPEIQYLAYLHNAEDQLRGEGASLRFFSAGQYQNGMVVRIAGLAYQKGFGGHFHNDNSVAALRDIPGLVLAVPSHPSLAPALLRGCLQQARRDGRVCVFLEPIARYHTRDLGDGSGDGQWVSPFAPTGILELGQVATHGSGRDLLLVTFGNGVHMSLQAAQTLAAENVGCTTLDLVWLAPVPLEALATAAKSAAAVLVVDETRHSGGVGEAVVSALVEAGVSAPIGRVASADSYIPLGPASSAVLLQPDEVVHAARQLIRRTKESR